MTDPGALSVDSGRIRYVLKEHIGKIAAEVEPFRQSGRVEEPPSQVTQPCIAGGDEFGTSPGAVNQNPVDGRTR